MKQLETAPRYLREMLVFPVSARAGVLRRAIRPGRLRGGLEGLRAAAELDRADSASAEIPREPARGAARHRVAGPRGEQGETPIADNCVGELGMRILFAEWLDAATGETRGGGLARRPLSLFRERSGARLENRVGRARRRPRSFSTRRESSSKSAMGSRSRASAIAPTKPTPRASCALRQTDAHEVILIDAATPEWTAALAGFR